MRERDSAPEEPIYADTPDEIILVEDYGAKMEVQVWYSPSPPKIKKIFKAGPRTEADVNDKLWMRREKLRIIREKAIIAGLGAISLHMSCLTDSSELDLTSETEVAQEITVPKNLSDLTPSDLGSLEPGQIIHVGDKHDLHRLELLAELNGLPDGIWMRHEKWSHRSPVSDLVKPEMLDGKKFHGKVSDITLEVMDSPGQKLFDAKNAKQQGLFIRSEKIPYNASDIIMAAVQESTIGFNIAMQIKSTSGVSGTASAQVWYTTINSPKGGDIRRSMTRPIVDEVSEINPNRTFSNGEITKRGGILANAMPNRTRRRQPRQD